MSESERTIQILRLAARLRGKKAEDHPNIAKQILVAAWQSLDWDERAAFMARLDDQLEFDPRGVSIKAYLNGWDLVMNQQLSDWEAGFAKSVARRRKDPTWYPSEREAKHIRRMYQDALLERQADKQEDVIE